MTSKLNKAEQGHELKGSDLANAWADRTIVPAADEVVLAVSFYLTVLQPTVVTVTTPLLKDRIAAAVAQFGGFMATVMKIFGLIFVTKLVQQQQEGGFVPIEDVLTMRFVGGNWKTPEEATPAYEEMVQIDEESQE